MHKTFHYIIVFLFLLPSLWAPAQSDDTAYAIYDTSSVPAPELLKDEETLFDPITEADALTVQSRRAERAAVKKLQEDDDFWYHNTAPAVKKPVQKKNTQPYKHHNWLPYLLWTIIVGGFVAFLVWFLMTSNVQLFKSSSKRISTDGEEAQGEDIFEIDYNLKIAAAIDARDYRLATRLLYLQLLASFSRKGIINYEQQKTNNDYVMQLYGTEYYKRFFMLTRHFEYTWYGKFPLSEVFFKELKEEFDQIKMRLKV